MLVVFDYLYHSQSYYMHSESPPARRSYDRNGFRNEERQNQLMTYLVDHQAELQRQKRWTILLPRLTELRNSGKEGEKRVIEEVREGVFDGLRYKVWPLLIQQPLVKFQDCRGLCENKQVNLDLERTFPTHKEAKALQQRMKIVLNALVVALPEVGYCQGMNFIVGTLLLRLSEEDAFKVAYHIFHWQKQEELLGDLSLIHEQLYALERPDEEALLSIGLVATGAINRSDFVRVFVVHNHVLQLAASLFRLPSHRKLPAGGYPRGHKGQKILYRVALQILRWKKKRLKRKTKVEDLVQELKNYDEFNEGNVDRFFREMFEIQLSRQEIRKYREEFRLKSPKNGKG